MSRRHARPQTAEKLLMLFNHTGGRRVFALQYRRHFFALLWSVSAHRGSRVSLRHLAGLPFDEQYDEVWQVAVVIGIHGANLVNAGDFHNNTNNSNGGYDDLLSE